MSERFDYRQCCILALQFLWITPKVAHRVSENKSMNTRKTSAGTLLSPPRANFKNKQTTMEKNTNTDDIAVAQERLVRLGYSSTEMIDLLEDFQRILNYEGSTLLRFSEEEGGYVPYLKK